MSSLISIILIVAVAVTLIGTVVTAWSLIKDVYFHSEDESQFEETEKY